MSEDTIDYKKLAEALAEALERRNLWIEGEEYRELVILRMRLSNKVESLAEELEAANARIAELELELNNTKFHAKALQELLTKSMDRTAELEAAQRWIPVGERLPDNWESVLTIDISKSTRDMVTAFYNPETSLWSTHFSCDLWVTHWMPIPESPIVYGKERE